MVEFLLMLFLIILIIILYRDNVYLNKKYLEQINITNDLYDKLSEKRHNHLRGG